MNTSTLPDGVDETDDMDLARTVGRARAEIIDQGSEAMKAHGLMPDGTLAPVGIRNDQFNRVWEDASDDDHISAVQEVIRLRAMSDGPSAMKRDGLMPDGSWMPSDEAHSAAWIEYESNQ